MADEIPAYRPGAVSPGVEDAAQRIKRLEQQLAEYQRRDLSRANIGQGGRLRGLYGNGNESVLFGVDEDDGVNKSQIKYSDGTTAFAIEPGLAQYGSVERVSIRDPAGNLTFASDQVSQYGLAHPLLACPIWGREELQPGANAGAAVVMGEGLNFVYNPAVMVSARMRCVHSSAGTTNISAYLELLDWGGAVLATSSTFTAATTGVIISVKVFDRMVLVPQAYIGQRLQVRVRVHSPTPANYGVTIYPFFASGVYKAWYDGYPQWQ